MSKYTTEYQMIPNTVIYKGDFLWLNEDGLIRPATGYDLRKNILQILISDIGQGKDKYKIAAEYKESGEEPTTIRVYEDPGIFHVVQYDEPETKEPGKPFIILYAEETATINEPISVLFTENKP